MIVVIDDERIFTDDDFANAVYLRDSDSALLWLVKFHMEYTTAPLGAMEPIAELWLDHDLGEASEFDGIYIARFIKHFLPNDLVETIFVHSRNPVGATAIHDEFLTSPIPCIMLSQLPNCTTIGRDE